MPSGHSTCILSQHGLYMLPTLLIADVLAADWLVILSLARHGFYLLQHIHRELMQRIMLKLEKSICPSKWKQHCLGRPLYLYAALNACFIIACPACLSAASAARDRC